MPLGVTGPAGAGLVLNVVIDTGFTETLAVPPKVVAQLGLPLVDAAAMDLADGSRVVVNVYEAVVEWHGQQRLIPAYEIDGGALVGMSLLRGSRMAMDVVDGGPVTIVPLL